MSPLFYLQVVVYFFVYALTLVTNTICVFLVILAVALSSKFIFCKGKQVLLCLCVISLTVKTLIRYLPVFILQYQMSGVRKLGLL